MSASNRSEFVDYARLVVRGGRGGNGCMSFRREKYVSMGGPDGGNGGKGGDVYLIADENLKSLIDFTYRPHYMAPDGNHGLGSDKYGAAGDDLFVHVPIGTLIYQNEKLLADLKQPKETLLVAKGGRGGRGNAAFKTQKNTAPEFSEKGEPGEEAVLQLELKLLADVGLAGLPNAGKSTLLSRLTHARPKIADYPFTTLTPNLGVADWHGTRFVIADIPGLIEGAHAGKGLGHDFLRHIERTRLLFHLVDVSSLDAKQIAADIRLIEAELKQHSKALGKKPRVLVLNKMDVTDSDKVLGALKKTFKKIKIFPISAVTGQGVDALLAYAGKEVAKPMDEEEVSVQEEPLRFVVEQDFKVERSDDGFLISGKRVERLASMTNFEQMEGAGRFQNILKKMGVDDALKHYGAKAGDTVRIGSIEFVYEPKDTYWKKFRAVYPGKKKKRPLPYQR